MVWEKRFFEKMQVFAYYKIIAVCRILMSEAWYLDTLANMIYDIKSQFVTIVTRMLSFLYTDNSLCELSVNRKLSILVAMVTEPWHTILFARISIVYHASDIKILHIAIILWKANTCIFSANNVFLKSFNLVLYV